MTHSIQTRLTEIERRASALDAAEVGDEEYTAPLLGGAVAEMKAS